MLYDIYVLLNFFSADVSSIHACVPMYVFTFASGQGRRGIV